MYSWIPFFILQSCAYSDPEKQFMLLVDHISGIRDRVIWERSPIQVYVEHNLGFEAEHHERALRGIRGVSFYRDSRRQRVGMLTTLQVTIPSEN